MKSVKPVKPIEPDVSDRKKYPKELETPADINSPFIRDYKQYQKDMKKYLVDIEIYEQTKLIEFVKVANPKLILKKYKIVKL